MSRWLHVLAWTALAGVAAWVALAVLALGLASGWPALHLPQIEINGLPWVLPWGELDPAQRPVAGVALGLLAAVLILPVAAMLPLLVVAAAALPVLLLVLVVVALVTLAACTPVLLLVAAGWLLWRGRQRRAVAPRGPDAGAAR